MISEADAVLPTPRALYGSFAAWVGVVEWKVWVMLDGAVGRVQGFPFHLFKGHIPLTLGLEAVVCFTEDLALELATGLALKAAVLKEACFRIGWRKCWLRQTWALVSCPVGTTALCRSEVFIME